MNRALKWTVVLLGAAVLTVGMLDHLYGYRYEDLFRVPEPEPVDWKDISQNIDLDDPDYV